MSAKRSRFSSQVRGQQHEVLGASPKSERSSRVFRAGVRPLDVDLPEVGRVRPVIIRMKVVFRAVRAQESEDFAILDRDRDSIDAVRCRSVS